MIREKNIHYFPGHMAKALKRLLPFIRSADLILEVCDARAPFSSRNPLLLEMIDQKPHLLILSKTDKADPKITKDWISYFHQQNLTAFGSDFTKNKVLSLLKKESEDLLEEKRAKEKRLGMKKQPSRLLVLGTPNVGKSTLINNIASKRVALASNRPGVTRAEQWIKVSEDFILLDTPGILPMNYDDEKKAINLALIGSIKSDVLPLDELASSALSFLRKAYPYLLRERYKIDDLSVKTDQEIYENIASLRSFLLSGGIRDNKKAMMTFLQELKDGTLGNISLERPSDAF